MKRPFPVGIPVKGYDLVGRKREISEMLNLVRNGQSIILISPRRYGKTSLLLEVLRQLKREGLYTAEIDIFKVLSKRELAQKITESVIQNRRINNVVSTLQKGISTALKHIRIKNIVNEYEFILEFTDPKADEERLLDSALDFPQIFSEKSKKEMIFAYDEFGDLVKLNGAPLIKKMRAIFQRHENVTYIFTGSQETIMEKLFSSQKEAFFRFGRIIRLNSIPSVDFEVYIQETFHTLGIEIAREEIDNILGKTECHPYYTQLVCQMLYYAVKGEKKFISKKDIERIFKEAVISEQPYFDEIWSNLMEKKSHLPILRNIALGNKFPYQFLENRRQDIYYVLNSLGKKGYLKRVKRGEYKLTDPLFQKYIRMRYDAHFVR